ncbi:MAG: hypothetical protein WAZ34_12740 [Rhodocyclaceae bacterium]
MVKVKVWPAVFSSAHRKWRNAGVAEQRAKPRPLLQCGKIARCSIH